jgi:hypothetical protein
MSAPLDSMDVRHVRREIRTALELALVSTAPSALIDRLAAVAGLLEVVAELPMDTARIAALVPELISRARSGLADWEGWRQTQDAKLPRG